MREGWMSCSSDGYSEMCGVRQALAAEAEEEAGESLKR